ncbi:dienelactone hydrolase family protein [Novosphingobium sp. Gsoil 351]|uniref:dienelactone hydrolase family protein n=1 Tax=Novosphingobium sp. Gsoil 351 TaxID=2675225 RepID=UPI0012B4BCF9|nr:dienelactone hydrolase family protein [Novosphingobium sp. Gsoil 351]QGN53499.1 dienelactone hydrolase family protein [Novosphingobium sp. Gsoil 351]
MGETIHIDMDDGHSLPVYHAVPEDQRRGGLVLIQEIFGVTEHIRELCDEYASEGYEVLSPGLFDRIEPGCALGYTGPDWERAVAIAKQEHDWEQGLRDTQVCIDWLKGRGGPVFIVGYCFGGSVAWRMAQTSPDLAAASCYYGGIIATRFADDPPLCATICHFAQFDTMVDFAEVEKLIEKQHPTAQIFVYEAGHGFNSDRRKDYHPPSADLALERTLALFKACGG